MIYRILHFPTEYIRTGVSTSVPEHKLGLFLAKTSIVCTQTVSMPEIFLALFYANMYTHIIVEGKAIMIYLCKVIVKNAF